MWYSTAQCTYETLTFFGQTRVCILHTLSALQKKTNVSSEISHLPIASQLFLTLLAKFEPIFFLAMSYPLHYSKISPHSKSKLSPQNMGAVLRARTVYDKFL